ncbi:MAG: GTPase HflX [Treponema sp.]|jgi:GTP-binding protein HflX|nr:GTPase HflX [Treponema sp.]
MKEIYENEQTPQKAFLVGIQDFHTNREEAASLSRELAGLAETLGVEKIGEEIAHIREHHPKYGMGSGKAEEIAEKVRELKADCIMFDQEISPSQQRNWEKLTGIAVVDRQEVIIQIFAGRARTREAELQVNLAELKYALPRLTHKYIDLNRQKGGSYGTKGSGETKLEMDRRQIEQKIHKIESELKEVRKNRAIQRKKRDKIPIPGCALVGYTNAGKSSLLNAMTQAEAFVEDKLFATLDPTTRRLEIGKGRPVLLTDTVGFIRRLPHDLIDAFKSTLEEASLASLLIHVLDASDPDVDLYYKTTMDVLRELGAEEIPMLLVFNKIDNITDNDILNNLLRRYPGSIPVSAKKNLGLDELAKRIDEALTADQYRFRFPLSRSDLPALLHRKATVINERYEDDYIEVEARVDAVLLSQLENWLFE